MEERHLLGSVYRSFTRHSFLLQECPFISLQQRYKNLLAAAYDSPVGMPSKSSVGMTCIYL